MATRAQCSPSNPRVGLAPALDEHHRRLEPQAAEREMWPTARSDDQDVRGVRSELSTSGMAVRES